MATILGVETGLNAPNLSSVGSSITLLFTLLFLALAIGIFLFWFINRKFYNTKFEFYENLGGGKNLTRTFVDHGKWVHKKGGIKLYWLRKRKAFYPVDGRMIALNTYALAKSSDGQWFNIVFGDLDSKGRVLDVEPVERDIQLTAVRLQQQADRDYEKVKFMDKYGTWIMGGMFMLLLIGATWFLLDKVGTVATSISTGVETANQVQEKSLQVISILDNICTGGSGTRPVPLT